MMNMRFWFVKIFYLGFIYKVEIGINVIGCGEIDKLIENIVV